MFLLMILLNFYLWLHLARSDLNLSPIKNTKTLLSYNNGLVSTGQTTASKTSSHQFTISLFEIALFKNKSTEQKIDSWCIKQRCQITPRTYFQPISANFSLFGFTDNANQGHILFLNKKFLPFHHIRTTVEGKAGVVSGLHGFYDGSFAAMLFVESVKKSDRKMWLQFYRSDFSVEWTTLLNSPISVPDRNIGDFRLSYGEGYFLAYFSVFGLNNFANGSNSDQVTFVDDRGHVKTTSSNIPNQEFVKSGNHWGCSHSLGQLASYHSMEKQFIVICSGDSFPEGISAGDSESGFLLFRAHGNGRGSTSAQLGQIAESNQGFKLLFNAESSCETPSCLCCPANGIGFVTIYNDINSFSGLRDVDDVIWLTSSNGSVERDPAIARMYIGEDLESARERYLVGWHDVSTDEYLLGIINKFGSFVKDPVIVSDISLTSECTDKCVVWGNRDDSFKTLPNGHVAWAYAPPSSKSLWFYEVEMEGAPMTGWSLWSSWSRCSRSCGTGEASRIRFCLSEKCKTPNQVAKKQCNIEKCTIPITCTFNYTIGTALEGDLFVNGKRIFGYTFESAKEKCVALRDVCRGLTSSSSRGNKFYFLRTGTKLITRKYSTAAQMHCEATPGWSKWSTWFACSAPCGTGSQKRERYCDGDLPESSVCEGTKIEERQFCNTGRCPHWSLWSRWTECSASCGEGYQRRTRFCGGDYPDQCDNIIGPFEEIKNCSLGVCPYWSEWSYWSTCSKTCGKGFKTRSRACVGNSLCIESDGGDGNKKKSFCDPATCAYWSDWKSSSSCRPTCGQSNPVHHRDCLGYYLVEQKCPLDGDRLQNETCSLGECPYWGSWLNWSPCSTSCGRGVRSRERTCLGDFPKKLCQELGNAESSEICNLGQCPYLDEWITWSQCSVTCGNGTRFRRRDCLGDFPCPEKEILIETDTCSPGICPYYGRWTNWGSCTVTCGSNGFRTRTRLCFGDFPHLCHADKLEEVGFCERLTDCPRWESWLSWGVCSKSCDYGERQRSRRCRAKILESCYSSEEKPATSRDQSNFTITQNVLDGFVETQTQQCINGLCSYWLDWVTWTLCSATCNRGYQSRTRKCFGDFPEMCNQKGSNMETRECNVGVCGSWSEWIPWGSCSHTCGNGTWNRNRMCLGDFSDMCIGARSETSHCSLADCVDVCMPNPCKNGGACRGNSHLTRMYHCVCPEGWMGKHCDHPGPEFICDSDKIILSFDRNVVAEEGLIFDDPSLVGLLSRDSPACTAIFDSFNSTEYYLIVVPTPIDSTCGSHFEVDVNSYKIRNQVIWQVEDKLIRSTVILIDFTCIYLKNKIISSDASSSHPSFPGFIPGTITLDSLSRETEIVTADGTFEVEITLFRDRSFQQVIRPENQQSLVSLAEGELVFVSVDLTSKKLLPSHSSVLIMDTCFVTSSKNEFEPFLYLVENRCPSSPFVTVLLNGVSRYGRFAIRVFGWTGKNKKAEDVFIHCAVSVCNTREEVCIPDCDSKKIKEIRRQKRSRKSNLSDKDKDRLKKLRIKTKRNENHKTDFNFSQFTMTSSSGFPYMSITKTVSCSEPNRSIKNTSLLLSKYNSKKLVSFGPLQVVLILNSLKREIRDIEINVAALDHPIQIDSILPNIVISLLLLTILCYFWLCRKNFLARHWRDAQPVAH